MLEDKYISQYSKLNDAQKEAVDYIYGALMVVAGPGTGKTQIIALRTANIILKAGINPENILITTFTDAGVLAIKKRLTKFLGTTGYKVIVSTIHSFAGDVIKSFPEKFVEFKLSTLIDEVESLEILKKITDKLIEEKRIDNLTNEHDKYLYLRDIKGRISNLKQEGVDYARFNELIEKQEEDYALELSEIKPTLKKYEDTKEKGEKHIAKLRELNVFYEEYNNYLRASSLYDYNDMINFVRERFESDKELRQFYAETFQFIMLDEYQDTNNAQNRIIELLLSESVESPNIMVVGDDDQSIYRFQGANIENMLHFANKYRDAKIIVIEDNYRSNQKILDLSNALINNNEERLSKKLPSINKKLRAKGNAGTNIPTLFRANSLVEEETYIIENIKNLLSMGEGAEEIAIIVRQNSEVEKWSNLLEFNGIEIESKLKTNIFSSPFVNYILDYLLIIDNPYSDEKKLLNVMRTTITGLNSIDIFKINKYLYRENYTKKYKEKIFDILQDNETLDELELGDKDSIIGFFKNTLELGQDLNSLNISEFFGVFLTKTGILEFVEKNGNFGDLEDIYTLLNKIKSWNSFDKSLNVERVFEKINLYITYNYIISRQILVGKNTGIQIMTAHSSKGLEFNNVFIPGLYYGNWDAKRVIDKLKLPIGIVGDGIQDLKNSSEEEERRLFFVAITRARNNLHLSFSATKDNKLLLESQFIGEINSYYEDITKPLPINEYKSLTENSLKNRLIEYSDLDLEYISSFLETYKISPSDLNTFIEDPMNFLHSIVFRYPFLDNKFTIFGSVYHRTLELFYLKFLNEQKIPEVSYLTSTFKLLIEKEILTHVDLENALEKGIKGLKGYYEAYKGKSEVPLVLEFSFRRKNLIFENIPLTGTIDKIEKRGETSLTNGTASGGQLAFFKDSVALIDYKTGKIKTMGEIKGTDRAGNKKPGEGKYLRQLMFYKLMCDTDNEFNSKFEVGSLEIDFVEGKDGEYKLLKIDYSEEDYEYFKNELREARKKISDIEYWRGLLRE